eukprot:TRINITY_DN13521_c0_g1_i1.p1 TRINITY_DN13521_c0_g1~~TRINITY_DN13521_c0_g1_i1.p1  ORF type:complete len:143 (+),score=14.91 TRINITY_DN13521_c0_g1_i1:69-497(+)
MSVPQLLEKLSARCQKYPLKNMHFIEEELDKIPDLSLTSSNYDYEILPIHLIATDKREEFILSLLQRLWEGSNNEDLKPPNLFSQLNENAMKDKLESSQIYKFVGLIDVRQYTNFLLGEDTPQEPLNDLRYKNYFLKNSQKN